MQDHLHFVLSPKQGNKVELVAQCRVWISLFFGPQQARVRVSNPQWLNPQILVNYPLGFKGAMSRGYCCFWSFLCITADNIHKMILESFEENIKQISSGSRQPWYFGDVCSKWQYKFQSLTIHGKRQQEEFLCLNIALNIKLDHYSWNSVGAKTHFKTESTRKLSNFNFQWTKTLYLNNVKHTAFFVTFFKG